MSPHDTLRDRLADAAGSVRPAVPDGPQLRRSAIRHRTRRRLVGGSAVVVALAAVAVAGGTLLAPRTSSLAPAAPSPSVTTVPSESASPVPAPSPSSSPDATPAPSTTEPAGPPPLTQAEAQAVVEDLRFPQEALWATGDYGTGPMEVQTRTTRWESASCSDEALVPDALAMRTVTLPDAEGAGIRQLAVFADAVRAENAFQELRAAIRGCLPPVGTSDGSGTGGAPSDSGGTLTTSLVGEQLDLGDESFWHGVKVVVTTDDGDTYESFAGYAEVLVLDDNVVTVFPQYPATSDQMRAEHVEQSAADWRDVVRPQYEPVLR